MEQPTFPTQEGLNALYGAWNPMAYIQGQQNQSLADQFRQQAYQRNALDTSKIQQEYDQNSLMNPLRVDNQRLTNEGQGLTNANLGFDNITKGLGVDRARANQDNLLKQDQRAAALKVTEDEMKQFEYLVQQKLQSNDPREQADGALLQNRLVSFQQERRKHQDAMALGKQTGEFGIQGDKIRAGATIRAAEIGADAKRTIAEAKAESDKAKAEAKLANVKYDAKLVEGEILRIPPAQRTPEQVAILKEATDRLNLRSASAMGLDLSSLSEKLRTNADKASAPKLSDDDLINQYLPKK
jgi:hypothetical protein